MREYGWQGDRPLQEWLYAQPWEFEFYQAVSLLEKLRPQAAAPGEGVEAGQETVRFSSYTGLEYSPSDLRELSPGDPPSMTVNFMGLNGVQGPLPHPDTERVNERIWYRDYALREFLDLFNHRLVSLLYKIRKSHRATMWAAPPERTPVARFLFSCFGLGLAPLQNRLAAPDRALLYYSGILSMQPRSAAGLEFVLADYFQTKVEVRQLQGRWHALEPDQWTRLGVTGQNQQLGQNAVAGTRIWDQQGAFELVLGPLSLQRFREFLPTGRAHGALCDLARFYVGLEHGYTIRLRLNAAEVPAIRLGESLLGWTSFLVTKPVSLDDDQVRVGSRSWEARTAPAS